jgi:FixJ family two-component response regulator
MSGIVLHQKLKERQVSPPCVVITAYDDAATREDIKGVPASVTLIKPFDGQALLEAIRNALDRCR